MVSTTQSPAPGNAPGEPPFDPGAITRPHPRLRSYFLILSLAAIIAMPVVYLRYYIYYKTLRFRFDDEGVWMAWGLLWRREVSLTYRRIQDIHLTRNLLQRWMGLATVSVQTASGSAGAEMTIDGVLEAEALRDYLYTRMRGARNLDTEPDSPAAAAAAPTEHDEALALLTQIRDALASLAARPGSLS